MATVNIAPLKVTLAQDRTGKLKKAATDRANAIFQGEVDRLKESFEDHSVTKELDQGPVGPNLTKTLVGGEERPTKNLFSFIGFYEGTSPTDPIRERLDPSHKDGPKLKYEGKSVSEPVFTFRVSEPNKEAIARATPLPWATSMSWVTKIETYIPGFAYFLSKEGMPFPPSRSSGGVQAKKGGRVGGELQQVRNAAFVPPKEGYLNTLFSDFLSAIKTNAKTGGRVRDSKGRFRGFEE